MQKIQQTLINIISILAIKDKQHWKDYHPKQVHTYNCTKYNATDISPYYLM